MFLHRTGKQETQTETPNSGVLRWGKFKENNTDLTTKALFTFAPMSKFNIVLIVKQTNTQEWL